MLLWVGFVGLYVGCLFLSIILAKLAALSPDHICADWFSTGTILSFVAILSFRPCVINVVRLILKVRKKGRREEQTKNTLEPNDLLSARCS